MTGAWGGVLAGQLDFYLQAHLYPRLEGLTQEEYLWRPVPSSLSLVPDGDAWRAEEPEPDAGPAALPTIAWRLWHVAGTNLGARVSAFFPDDPDRLGGVGMWDPRHEPAVPADVEGALDLLRTVADRWLGGLGALSDEELLRPLGSVGEAFADDPMAALAAHVSRETMHHGGEICLLRDLYAVRG